MYCVKSQYGVFSLDGTLGTGKILLSVIGADFAGEFRCGENHHALHLGFFIFTL